MTDADNTRPIYEAFLKAADLFVKRRITFGQFVAVTIQTAEMLNPEQHTNLACLDILKASLSTAIDATCIHMPDSSMEAIGVSTMLNLTNAKALDWIDAVLLKKVGLHSTVATLNSLAAEMFTEASQATTLLSPEKISEKRRALIAAEQARQMAVQILPSALPR